MNCSWCHKPIQDDELSWGDVDCSQHSDCHLLLNQAKSADLALQIYCTEAVLKDRSCDPMASAEAQRLLAEYRRLNRLALAKLDAGNRARLMFGQPLLD